MLASSRLVADQACGFGKAVPFTWRFVEQSFHNDNRLSWWLAHLSSPLGRNWARTRA